ncbi:hypothetical protein [Desmonostoc muscorum]|uniref:Uncharacterized protein n=1 Tax=Desmonostoc muscorum LEGE 12446 TaxID=1828758 RepID=A0A8J6ZR10_DESMC|nr:hypothetical protein [Desmonostoc muscorum]
MKNLDYLIFRYTMKAEGDIKNLKERIDDLESKKDKSQEEIKEYSILKASLEALRDYEKKFTERIQSAESLNNPDTRKNILEDFKRIQDNKP